MNPTGLRLLDIRPGAASADPGQLTRVGDRLYFTANDGIHGTELWWTVADSLLGLTAYRNNIKVYNGIVFPSPAITLASSLDGVVGNSLYFSGYSPGSGFELWRTNSSGAALFKDLLPARFDSSDPVLGGPWNFIGAGDSLFFQSGVIRSFIDSNGNLQEFIENQLWHSDGTPEGTQPLGLALSRFGVAQLRDQFAVGNTLFFSALNDNFTQLNLWKSDGTPQGTQDRKSTRLNSSHRT